jgi:hypothetical protein
MKNEKKMNHITLNHMNQRRIWIIGIIITI